MEKEVLSRLKQFFDSQDSIEFYDADGLMRHYVLKVISDKFKEKSPLERAKIVNKLLQDLLLSGSLHSLKTILKSPSDV